MAGSRFDRPGDGPEGPLGGRVRAAATGVPGDHLDAGEHGVHWKSAGAVSSSGVPSAEQSGTASSGRDRRSPPTDAEMRDIAAGFFHPTVEGIEPGAKNAARGRMEQLNKWELMMNERGRPLIEAQTERDIEEEKVSRALRATHPQADDLDPETPVVLPNGSVGQLGTAQRTIPGDVVAVSWSLGADGKAQKMYTYQPAGLDKFAQEMRDGNVAGGVPRDNAVATAVCNSLGIEFRGFEYEPPLGEPGIPIRDAEGNILKDEAGNEILEGRVRRLPGVEGYGPEVVKDGRADTSDVDGHAIKVFESKDPPGRFTRDDTGIECSTPGQCNSDSTYRILKEMGIADTISQGRDHLSSAGKLNDWLADSILEDQDFASRYATDCATCNCCGSQLLGTYSGGKGGPTPGKGGLTGGKGKGGKTTSGGASSSSSSSSAAGASSSSVLPKSGGKAAGAAPKTTPGSNWNPGFQKLSLYKDKHTKQILDELPQPLAPGDRLKSKETEEEKGLDFLDMTFVDTRDDEHGIAHLTAHAGGDSGKKTLRRMSEHALMTSEAAPSPSSSSSDPPPPMTRGYRALPEVVPESDEAAFKSLTDCNPDTEMTAAQRDRATQALAQFIYRQAAAKDSRDMKEAEDDPEGSAPSVERRLPGIEKDYNSNFLVSVRGDTLEVTPGNMWSGTDRLAYKDATGRERRLDFAKSFAETLVTKHNEWSALAEEGDTRAQAACNLLGRIRNVNMWTCSGGKQTHSECIFNARRCIEAGRCMPTQEEIENKKQPPRAIPDAGIPDEARALFSPSAPVGHDGSCQQNTEKWRCGKCLKQTIATESVVAECTAVPDRDVHHSDGRSKLTNNFPATQIGFDTSADAVSSPGGTIAGKHEAYTATKDRINNMPIRSNENPITALVVDQKASSKVNMHATNTRSIERVRDERAIVVSNGDETRSSPTGGDRAYADIGENLRNEGGFLSVYTIPIAMKPPAAPGGKRNPHGRLQLNALQSSGWHFGYEKPDPTSPDSDRKLVAWQASAAGWVDKREGRIICGMYGPTAANPTARFGAGCPSYERKALADLHTRRPARSRTAKVS
ncbi:unnamed protein product [Amoebophrya sp. A25]|nr:unnamed protein product [Amoebophrya sp. A25]|eukprot:GSA25T00022142001.1